MRCFELHRIEDISGVSGTGLVAQGVEFDDGTVALRWLTEWPTSVVFHDRGAEAVEHVHGHNGRTQVVWGPSVLREPDSNRPTDRTEARRHGPHTPGETTP
jgi:hypothetical protein